MAEDTQVSATEQVVVRLTTIGELLTERGKAGFTIPNYQRGFAWTTKEVNPIAPEVDAFIESIKDVNTPFLGNFIIHEEARNGAYTFNLVDGQQRMTCILMALGATGLLHLDEGHQFSDSIKLLRDANDLINKSISEKDKTELRNKKIQLTIVDDIDLAFTFYDNANTAGQPLQAKDIIKSRHLLAMSQNGQAHLMVEAARIWKEMENYGRKENEKEGKELKKFLYHLLSVRNFRKRQWERYIYDYIIAEDINLNEVLIKEFAEKKSILQIKPGTISYNIPLRIKKLTFVNEWPWLGSIDMQLEPGWLTFKYIEHYFKKYLKIINVSTKFTDWFDINYVSQPFILLNQISLWGEMVLEDLCEDDLISVEEQHYILRINLAYLLIVRKNFVENIQKQHLPDGYSLEDIFIWFGSENIKKTNQNINPPDNTDLKMTGVAIKSGWEHHKTESNKYILKLKTKKQA